MLWCLFSETPGEFFGSSCFSLLDDLSIFNRRLLYLVIAYQRCRVMESVFEKLINWAANALEKSSNQPVLPAALIALNASENDIDPSLWNVDIATEEMLQSLSRTVFHNATFQKYAQFWRERGRQIESVEALLLSYYSSVRVVRIPTRGRPTLIQEQVAKLYECVTNASMQAIERKGQLRMLLDAEELQPYLQDAFGHFARNLDTPFDFVQASFSNSPIPLDFGGNILKLVLAIVEIWKNQISPMIVFQHVSYMVASCIMLDSARHKLRGTAEQVFPQYLEHLDAALENFCDRHWPCEYVNPRKGARCVNVRSGHGTKGHQDDKGKVLADGEYESNFTFAGYQEEFRGNVYAHFDELYQILRERVVEGDVNEEDAAAEIHRDKIMAHFFEQASRGRAMTFVSHSACFCCLSESPEHPLPCGHVLCTPCLKAYGHLKTKDVIEIFECPMEARSRPRYQSWIVNIKPASAGVRLLTLDGGGIRGIAELETLRQIEKALGGKIRIQSFFDMIIGTSTGGVIALGLGVRNWSVEETTNVFTSLCAKAFTRRFGGNIPGVGFFVDNYHHSMYETAPLEDALKFAFTEDQHLFGGFRPHHMTGGDIKVGVTATTSAGSTALLTNYNRLCNEKLHYKFQRPEGLAQELKTWEAARATSAAPRMFKPICHKPSNQVYIDGAVYYNNPMEIADRERKLIWNDLYCDTADIVLSVGTCWNPDAKRKDEDRPSTSRRGILAHGKSLYNIMHDVVASTTDSERAFQKYMSILSLTPTQRERYVRLNPPLKSLPPKLDEIKKLEWLQEYVRLLMADSIEVKKVAKQLVATCFYFEQSETPKPNGDGTITCKGHICCRLPSGGGDIAEVGKLLRSWTTMVRTRTS